MLGCVDGKLVGQLREQAVANGVIKTDDKVKVIRPDKDDVWSQGYICPKGVALKDLHEDPDRLRKPLVKRDGRFVEVGWDEAFDEIERRLPPSANARGSHPPGV